MEEKTQKTYSIDLDVEAVVNVKIMAPDREMACVLAGEKLREADISETTGIQVLEVLTVKNVRNIE